MKKRRTDNPKSTGATRSGKGNVVPERFLVSKGTLRFDRFMTQAIQVGGLVVVLAVFGIFAFILSVIWPLFGGAEVAEGDTMFELEAPEGVILGLDDWGELPFVTDGGRELVFHPVDGREPFVREAPLPDGAEVSSLRHDPGAQRIVAGFEDGRAGFFEVRYTMEFEEGRDRRVEVELGGEEWFEVAGGPVHAAAYADGGSNKLLAAVHDGGENGARSGLAVVGFRQQRGLLGGGRIEAMPKEELGHLVGGPIAEILIPATADMIFVATDQCELVFLAQDRGEWTVRQRMRMFDDPETRLTTLGFALGDNSIVAGGSGGEVRVFSLFPPKPGEPRTLGLTKEFPGLSDAPVLFAASRRNKTVFIASENELLIGYTTTETVRWRGSVEPGLAALALNGRGSSAAFLDTAGRMRFFEINDPHPEAGMRAFFSPIWYEGFSGPRFSWQSGGATDDFESKLSITPLIVGSLKGTAYAMLFAMPIAILAAIFTAHVLHPSWKRVIKPTMEIMASLPSVVLGFLAAIWLAPLVEYRMPGVFLMMVGIPIVVVVIGYAWSWLPVHLRSRLPTGLELVLLLPVVLGVGWLCWRLGPVVEQWLFVVEMPDGSKVADFTVWWPQWTGLPFSQRNSFVVGFMMGFAVIPIIFTITEDALSNVPPSLLAASRALGATRWQVISTVVLPVASAGVFSAVMIGLGRAVGETMIVVMATGNTAIMDPSNNLIFGSPFGLGSGEFPLAAQWNPFDGMRTLAANIAVELPEAAQGSTHYRTLFLGAFVLFVMTFALNTVAEVLRQRLREKFKLV